MRLDLGGLAPLLGSGTPAEEDTRDCPAWDAVTLDPAGTTPVPVSQDCPAEPVKALLLPETATEVASVGSAFSYSVIASGGRGTLSYRLLDEVEGISLVGNAVRATFGTVGQRVVRVAVDDLSTPVQTRIVTVTINVAAPLVFTQQPTLRSVVQGGSVSASFVMAPGNDLRFTLEPGLPAGLTQNPSNGVISAAANTPIGIYTARTRATDVATGAYVVSDAYQISVSSLTAQNLRLTVPGGTSVTISGWKGVPLGNMTYTVNATELQLFVDTPCGYMRIRLVSGGNTSNSWTGSCNTGRTFDAYWLYVTGQISGLTHSGLVLGSPVSRVSGGVYAAQ